MIMQCTLLLQYLGRFMFVTSCANIWGSLHTWWPYRFVTLHSQRCQSLLVTNFLRNLHPHIILNLFVYWGCRLCHLVLCGGDISQDAWEPSRAISWGCCWSVLFDGRPWKFIGDCCLANMLTFLLLFGSSNFLCVAFQISLCARGVCQLVLILS